MQRCECNSLSRLRDHVHARLATKTEQLSAKDSGEHKIQGSARSRFTKRAGRALTSTASRRRLERRMQRNADGRCRECIRQAVVDEDMSQQRLQEAMETPGTKGSAEEQGDRGEIDQEGRMKRNENPHTQDKAERRQEGEGGSRQERHRECARAQPEQAASRAV